MAKYTITFEVVDYSDKALELQSDLLDSEWRLNKQGDSAPFRLFVPKSAVVGSKANLALHEKLAEIKAKRAGKGKAKTTKKGSTSSKPAWMA